MKDELISWMDRLDVTPEALSERMGVSVKTVYNWRTSGVPERKEDHLRRVMASWTAGPELGKLILRPTDDQFRRWNLASISGTQPRTMEDWAMEALDEAAAEDEADTTEPQVITFPEIPLLHAAAGAPISSDGDTWTPDRDLGPGRFACQLHGDSMAPRYPDGAVVILRERQSLKNPAPKKGEVYLFDLEGEKTLKVYDTRPATEEEIAQGLAYISKRDGKAKVPVLRPINPEFPEVAVREDVEWIGWLDKADNR